MNAQLKGPTSLHMEDYGSSGLRTLCLSYNELDPKTYDAYVSAGVLAAHAVPVVTVDQDSAYTTCGWPGLCVDVAFLLLGLAACTTACEWSQRSSKGG